MWMSKGAAPATKAGCDEKCWQRSRVLLERALATIPVGSQTFSKSFLQLPLAQSPLFVESAKGAHFIDVDGNDYVDLVMGLGCVSLGYRDPDVDAAVRAQLEQGIIFSLPSTLEMELSEKLVETIPSAEMVRFGKNGSDVTSAAVRLARAFTGREHIIACGYHGWHDWYIGSTSRHLGVPQSVRSLTHSAPYNDLDAVEDIFREHPDSIAAIILEPASVATPKPGFLEGLRDLTERNGALLVFDEIVTGFRWHIGGAQSYYGVIPDLACFGKGMANGMPISAVVGRRDVMRLMEDIFFSGTFGGECLSLAASLATIDKMQRLETSRVLWRRASYLRKRIEKVIKEAGLEEHLQTVGEDCLFSVVARDSVAAPATKIRSFMMGEMMGAGVFTLSTFGLCHAFSDPEEERVVDAFTAFADRLRQGLERGSLDALMSYPPIEPVFSVRKY